MIGAIVVLYNPSFKRLDEALMSLIEQVDEVILIDNSSFDYSNELSKWNKKITYIPLMKNTGIAHAQNLGISYLLKRGFEYALFSDQDTVCSPGMVNYMLKAHKEISKKHEIAAIGPIPINKETGKHYFKDGYLNTKTLNSNIEYYDVKAVMSSYSLIKLNVFEKVGLYNERLFIDAVETSWCFKASYFFGLKSFVLPGVCIDHQLGQSTKFLGKQISISSPFRVYYQFRNLLWESREEYTPKFWKKRNLFNILPKILYYSILGKNRIKYITNIYRGLRDGLLRKERNQIPQYAGSIPDPKTVNSFNGWIKWYQEQPVSSCFKVMFDNFKNEFDLKAMTNEFVNDDSCQKLVHLLVFKGEIKAVIGSLNNKISEIDVLISKKLRDKIKSLTHSILFLSIDAILDNLEIKVTGLSLYSGNGFYKFDKKTIDLKLGEYFKEAYEKANKT